MLITLLKCTENIENIFNVLIDNKMLTNLTGNAVWDDDEGKTLY